MTAEPEGSSSVEGPASTDDPASSSEDALIGKIEEDLEQVPPEQRPHIASVLAARLELMAGHTDMPILPTGMLADLNREVTDGANRAMAMAEEQAAHRRHLELLTVESGVRRASEGLRYGFVVALSGLGAAITLAGIGHPVVGGAVGVVDLVALVSVFVYGSSQQRRRAAAPDPAPARHEPPQRDARGLEQG